MVDAVGGSRSGSRKTLTAEQTGPLSLKSPEAQVAVARSKSYLVGRGQLRAYDDFRPKLVERCDQNMLHVRLDRHVDGLRVFGEQAVCHLKGGKVVDMDGETETAPIPADVREREPEISKERAIEIAKERFGGEVDREPVCELVFQKDDAGNYQKAWRVELVSLSVNNPARMNYMLDVKTGAVLDQFNQLDDRVPEGRETDPATLRPQQAKVPVKVDVSTRPDLSVGAGATVRSTVVVPRKVKLSGGEVSVRLSAKSVAECGFSLTAPSGQRHPLTTQASSGLRVTFQLPSALKGAQGQGRWTLEVADQKIGTKGKLEEWGLTLAGTGAPDESGNDKSLYSGTVDLQTTKQENGKFTLIDPTRNGSMTLDAQNKSRASNAVKFEDADDLWGQEGDDPRSKAAVDAHYGAQMTWDVYKNVLNRNSIDGKGEKLVSNVHIGRNYVNAFWDGKQMNYGDGDNKTASELTTLDVAGHEIGHGLTERTAGLIYRGESGGINEAMSDILGTASEWYAAHQNPNVKWNFDIGDACWTPGKPGDALRYMSDPTKDNYSIDHFKNYPKQQEVHGSSGIVNNAFYLLAEGGTNRTSQVKVEQGIGFEKALKIFYRALAFYMTPSTTFAQARVACEKAATDLHGAGSAELKTLQRAWHAVGVGEAPAAALAA